ncbi:MAG: SMC family ATPase [Candidatus Omnitrophota bacterium]
MIPVRLKLRNFLSYGEDAGILDFSSFKLACLTGRNGHGKSALLDAITWAVWGEARKAGYSRAPDAGLLRLGADEMAVEFTFQLEDREFQVSREFRSAKQTSKLEFRGRSSRDDDFRLLTGASKKETQKRIVDTLGLDYKTFINSSFLQQGKADEFTRQSPQDRKEILGAILGLHYYDRLLEEAKQRWSASRSERRNLEEAVERLDRELEEEENIREQEKQRLAELSQAENRWEAIRREEKQLQEEISNLLIVRDRMSRWDQEEERARQSLSEIDRRRKKDMQEQDALRQIAEREKEIEQDYLRYDEAERELKKLLDVEARSRAFQEEKDKIEREIEAQCAGLREQLASLTTDQTHWRNIQEESRAVINRKEEIESNYVQFQNTQSECARLEALHPEYERLQATLQQSEALIEKERQILAERAAEMRGALKKKASLEKEMEAARAELLKLPALENEHSRLQTESDDVVKQGQQTNQLLERLSGEMERLQNLVAETGEKLRLLRQGGARECPLCGADLDPSRQKRMEEQFEADIAAAQNQISQTQREIAEKEKLRDALRAQFQTLQNKMPKIDKQLTRLRQLQEKLKEQETEILHLNALQEQLDAIAQQMQSNQFAEEARIAAEQSRQALAALAYEPVQRAAAIKRLQKQQNDEWLWLKLQEEISRFGESQTRLAAIAGQMEKTSSILETENFALPQRRSIAEVLEQLQPLEKELTRRRYWQEEQNRLRNAISDWNSLQAAKQRLPELDAEIEALQKQSAAIEQQRRSIEEQRQQAIPSLHRLQECEKQRHELESQRAVLETSRNEIQFRLGALREKIARLQEAQNEKRQSQERLRSVLDDERHYGILKTAFSRDGIPAMIVEQSLPDLENGANRLLQRLTNGAASLALESQREKKSGGAIETLDIKISDEMGTRDYELYSGGEAFRVDLALRIALSQLLCRRAGSQLRLLVIDEGFGSQDGEGLANIVDAINDIQDEFDKIIVVTHLDELKEMFMARIEVTKEPGIGSRFDVIHTF